MAVRQAASLIGRGGRLSTGLYGDTHREYFVSVGDDTPRIDRNHRVHVS